MASASEISGRDWASQRWAWDGAEKEGGQGEEEAVGKDVAPPGEAWAGHQDDAPALQASAAALEARLWEAPGGEHGALPGGSGRDPAGVASRRSLRWGAPAEEPPPPEGEPSAGAISDSLDTYSEGFESDGGTAAGGGGGGARANGGTGDGALFGGEVDEVEDDVDIDALLEMEIALEAEAAVSEDDMAWEGELDARSEPPLEVLPPETLPEGSSPLAGEPAAVPGGRRAPGVGASSGRPDGRPGAPTSLRVPLRAVSGAAPDGVHPDSPGPAAPAAAASPGAVQTPGSSRGRPEGGAAGAIRLSRSSQELLREADRRLEEVQNRPGASSPEKRNEASPAPSSAALPDGQAKPSPPHSRVTPARPPSASGASPARRIAGVEPPSQAATPTEAAPPAEVPNMSSPLLSDPVAPKPGREPNWLAEMKVTSPTGEAYEIDTSAPAFRSVRSGRRALLPSLSQAAALEEKKGGSGLGQADGISGTEGPSRKVGKVGKLAALRAEQKKRDELLRQSLDTPSLFERNQQVRLLKGGDTKSEARPKPAGPGQLAGGEGQEEATELQPMGGSPRSAEGAALSSSVGGSRRRSPRSARKEQSPAPEPVSTASPRLPTRSADADSPASTQKTIRKLVKVPVLPVGRVLEIEMLSTWGDMHYIALSAIEVFNAAGYPIDVPAHEYRCTPDSMNVLEGYADDPRNPDKLFDGTNFICDDMHTWLAPFAAGQAHRIRILLQEETGFSLLRFWNCNKSRVHAARGVRGVRVTLDGEAIFEGELARAPGSLANRDAAETEIFFHPGAEIRAAIAAHDSVLEAEEPAPPVRKLPRPSLEVVPSEDQALSPAGRGAAGSSAAVEQGAGQTVSPAGKRPSEASASGPRARGVRELRLDIVKSWGDKHFVGLSGMEVLDDDGKALPLLPSSVSAKPRDLNDLPGCSADDRTIDKVLDGVNVTTDDSHMWLAPIPNGGPPNTVTVRFDEAYAPTVSAVRLWNYNKTLDDTGRGVRELRVFADGLEVTPSGGVIARKAPGLVDFDSGHTVPLALPDTDVGARDLQADAGNLDDPWANCLPAGAWALFPAAAREPHVAEVAPQDFVPGVLPCGFVLKILIHSTWGDAHYCSLTGLGVVDAARGELRLAPSQVHAESAQSLQENGRIGRSADKLVDGVHDPASPANSWLAPFTPGSPQAITVDFGGTPAILAALRFWNYAKDPARGAKEVEAYLDDRLVYHGFVRCFVPSVTGKGPSRFQQSVLFSGAGSGVVKQEREHLYVHSPEAEITLVDEGKFRSTGAPEVGGVLEPGASGLLRPGTALNAHS